MAVLWSGYQLGSWTDLLPKGLGPISFRPAIEQLIGSVDHEWIIENSRDVIGLVLAREVCAGRAVEAQVDWFEWSTARQRLEGVAAALKEMTKHFQVLVFSTESDKPFWLRFCRYRLLRNGCTVLNHFGPGEHAFFFYTAG
jgi:hypothetical protein